MLPHLIGSDVSPEEVRAVADLARLEAWDEVFFCRVCETPYTASIRRIRRSVSNKLVILWPYLALIGLAGIAAAVLTFNRKKPSRC